MKLRLKLILKIFILMVIGGLLYIAIELLWRGRSHWTMFILGGFCFAQIGSINEFYSWEMKLWKQAVVGSIIVTILEFFVGLIVNVALGWHIWDYSDTPFNILGQVCLPYMILWVGLMIPAILLDDFLRWKLFGEEKPRYKLF